MITVIYFWRVRRGSIPLALFHMAVDRFSLSRNRNIKFFKSLGTGKGETFTPRDADATRWGLLITIEESELAKFQDSKLINSWRKFAESEYRAVLQPISSHGKWAGLTPFHTNPENNPQANRISNWEGPIAAITRARIKFRLNSKFWRAVPPVTASLQSSRGLLGAIGIGEAPIGLQGTFSRWESAKALREFAYNGQAHSRAIEMTKQLDWYSEELFARFAIIQEHGEF